MMEHTQPADERFSLGTLHYTRAALAVLFFWMLWGDFCFNMMESVIPRIIPLKLNSLGAPDWVITSYTGTIYYVMNAIMNPIVSFRSDRHRGPWGRRIPFLLFATPFVTVVLVLLAFSEPIGAAIHRWGIGGSTSAAATMLTIGVLLVLFQFFNMFIASVYYYLFNDVVPEAFLARFMALFRVVGAAASFAFNMFVFPYAQSHMRIIFVSSALFYFVAFSMMCLRVKEGEYPPPPPLDRASNALVAAIKTYLRECFSQKLFLYYFAFCAFLYASTAVMSLQDLFALSVGVSMQQIGFWNAWLGIPGIVLMYPAGSLADRIGAQRLFVAVFPAFLVYSLLGFFVVRGFNTWLLFGIIFVPLSALRGVLEMTMNYTTFPRERFGQFASANAMVISIVSAVAGVAAGLFMDFFKHVYHGAPDHYRYMYLWTLLCQIPAFLMLVLFYREWQRRQASEAASAGTAEESAVLASGNA